MRILTFALLPALASLAVMPAAQGQTITTIPSAERAAEAETALQTIRLRIDFASLLQIEEGAATIILGNAGIADASLADERTLVLTGRAAGTTNLLALDESGAIVAEALLQVSSGGPGRVTIYRGAAQQTYACTTDQCEPVLAVGDAPDYFSATQSQIQGAQQFTAAE